MKTASGSIRLDTVTDGLIFRFSEDPKPYMAEVARGLFDKRIEREAWDVLELVPGCFEHLSARVEVPEFHYGHHQPNDEGGYYGFSVVFEDAARVDFVFQRGYAPRRLIHAIKRAFEAHKEQDNGRELRQAGSPGAEGRAEAEGPGRGHSEGHEGGAPVQRREGDGQSGQAGQVVALGDEARERALQRKEHLREQRRAARVAATMLDQPEA